MGTFLLPLLIFHLVTRSTCYVPEVFNSVTAFPVITPSNFINNQNDFNQETIFSSTTPAPDASSTPALNIASQYWWQNTPKPYGIESGQSGVEVHSFGDAGAKVTSANGIAGIFQQNSDLLYNILLNEKSRHFNYGNPIIPSSTISAIVKDYGGFPTTEVTPISPVTFSSVLPPTPTPYLRCPTSLKCVPDHFCTAEGFISKSPIILTPDVILSRIPLAACFDETTKTPGKCCREFSYQSLQPDNIPKPPATINIQIVPSSTPKPSIESTTSFNNSGVSVTNIQIPFQQHYPNVQQPLYTTPKPPSSVLPSKPLYDYKPPQFSYNVPQNQPNPTYYSPQPVYQSNYYSYQTVGSLNGPSGILKISLQAPDSSGSKQIYHFSYQQNPSSLPGLRPSFFTPPQTFNPASSTQYPSNLYPSSTFPPRPEFPSSTAAPVQPFYTSTAPTPPQPSYSTSLSPSSYPKPVYYPSSSAQPYPSQQPSYSSTPAPPYSYPSTPSTPFPPYQKPLTYQPPGYHFSYSIQQSQPSYYKPAAPSYSYPSQLSPSAPTYTKLPAYKPPFPQSSYFFKPSYINPAPFQPSSPSQYSPGYTKPPLYPSYPSLPPAPSYTTQKPFPTYQPSYPQQPSYPPQQPSYQPVYNQNPQYALFNTQPPVYQTETSKPEALLPPIPPVIVKEYSSVCGIRSNDGTAYGNAPWHAIVYSNRNKDLICAGAIVAENVVITAAHCLDHSEAATTEVKLGPEGRIFKVAALARHPDYNIITFNRDLALVFLREPIPFDKYEMKICLPSNFSQMASGDRECYVSTLTKEFDPKTLEMMRIKVTSYKDCESKLSKTYLGKYFALNESFSCGTAPSDKILCEVKTGSPIACKKVDGTYELLGIKSWDLGCQQFKNTAIFSNFDIDWVQKTIPRPIYQLIAEERERQQKEKSKEQMADAVNLNQPPAFLYYGYGKK